MVYGGYEISNNTNKMRKYVENALYKELVDKAYWTLSAFGFLQIGDKLKGNDYRFMLLQDLVSNHIKSCPLELCDEDVENGWRTKEFIWVVKEALNILKGRV